MRRRGRRRDEAGQALVEFALVLPLVVLLVGIAFNGWNGMQLSLRLASAARAGALTAASDLPADPNVAPTGGQMQTALTDATTAINQEEGVTNVYQSTNPAASNYVTISQSADTITGGPTINIVTISISQAPVTLVPFVGKISVSAHATARYS
jgi:Flp pilus assembly protein TadG